jgi:hypothetical protein
MLRLNRNGCFCALMFFVFSILSTGYHPTHLLYFEIIHLDNHIFCVHKFLEVVSYFAQSYTDMAVHFSELFFWRSAQSQINVA